MKSLNKQLKAIGKKTNKGLNRAGNELKKTTGVMKKAGGVGRQIARGINKAADVADMAAALSPVLGPQAAVLAKGIAGGLNAASSGIHGARTVGANAVKFANQM